MRKPTYEELETKIKELETEFQKEQKAEQDIREAEMQCKFFMNTLPDIVYRLDKEGNIIQVNKAVEKYGYKIEEVQGSSIFEFVHSEDKEKVQYRINERRTGDRATKDLEVRLFTKEGEEKIVETRAAVVTENFFKVTAEGLYTSDKPAEESFSGTFGVARDITERKRIEDELHSELYKLKALTNGLDKIGVSIDIVDLDYNIVYQTEQLIETFGESAGKRCYEVYMGLDQPCEQCPIEKAIESKSVQSIELKGKDERFYHLFSVPFINPDGTIDKVIEIVQDITERKNAEKSIIEEKEFTETAVNALTDTFFVYDPANGKAIRWNRNFNRVTGYSDEEIASMKAPDDWYSEEDLKKAEEAIEKTFQEGHAIIEMSLITKSGKTAPTEYSSVMIKDNEGNPKYIIAIGRDITERKKAEEALKESEEKYRNLVDRANDGIIINKDGILRFVNDRAADMMGYNVEEMMNNSFLDYVYPDERERIINIYKKRLQGMDVPDIYEMGALHKNGEKIDVEINSGIISYEGNPAVLSFVRDITERKKAEKELLYFQKAVDGSSDAIGMSTPEGKHYYQNEAFDKLFGLSIQDVEGEAGPASTIYADEKVGRDVFETIMRGDSWIGEVEMLNKDKQKISVLLRAYSIKDENDNIIGLVGVHTDITERKQVEEELQKLASVVRHSSELVNLATLDGKMIFLNDAGSKMLGIDIEDVEKVNIMQVIPDHLQEVVQLELLPELMENRTWEGELQYLNLKTGTLTDVYAVTFTITDPVTGAPLYLANVSLDITDRKKAEEEAKKLQEQLIQAQKMESIGRLAGGIAHDFNNILVSIMGYAELLKMKFNDPSTNENQVVDVIIQEAVRAADLTKQLLGFARGGKYNPIPLNINSAIEDTVRVLEKIFEKNIKVEYDFENNVNTIEADENQMSQVLTNIIINAKDAMPHGGKLIFKTENVYFDEEYTKINPEVKSGVYVKISITDTGTGMTKEVKNSMFEPFYSTKGKGTGLGLATVYGIVNNHGGHINVYSEPGEGTIFTLYFHVTDREVKKKEKVAAIIKGEAAILVVDDEEHVRDLTEEVLMELGYEVILAKNGKEAIKLYEERKNEIDLVLLDMIMPEMAGRETNLRLRNINPDVRVLLSSGYSQNGIATEILNEGAVGFIQKPFKIQELSKVINDILKK